MKWVLQFVMNSKSNNNIYQISRQIEEEKDKLYQLQAKKITNAYRQVQQLKVEKMKPNSIHKQQPIKPKPQSTYAAKIKETLKQINANRTKEGQNNPRIVIAKTEERKIKNQIQKLYNVANSKINSSIQSYTERLIRNMFRELKQYAIKSQKQETYFIKKFRKFKIFRAWKDQTLFSKFEKQKDNQNESLQASQLAKQFRCFNVLKKSFRQWSSITKKQKKRKNYQKQLLKNEIDIQRREEKKTKSPKIVEQNQQLQNKVRNFLEGLKEKVENKDRLRTIKEKTQQSDLNIKMAFNQNVREESINEEHPSHDQQQTSINNNEVIIEPPNQMIYQKVEKQMTNEQLQKKRKQLQLKHKSRKQVLEKLKKQKQQKKRQEELERIQLQKQMEKEQKLLKQLKYKQYIKNKQQQQQWQKREKELELRAEQFSIIRIKKFYGWIPLATAKKIKKRKVDTLYQTLLLIIFRVKSSDFLRNLELITNNILQDQYQRMEKRYKLRLLRKGLTAIYQYRSQQLQIKEEMLIRHQVYQLKIYFKIWKRELPQLKADNFDWERPRIKRAEEYHRLQLLHRGMQMLRINKQEQQKNRIIVEQKNKIKTKIRNMLEQSDEINYESFL